MLHAHRTKPGALAALEQKRSVENAQTPPCAPGARRGQRPIGERRTGRDQRDRKRRGINRTIVRMFEIQWARIGPDDRSMTQTIGTAAIVVGGTPRGFDGG